MNGNAHITRRLAKAIGLAASILAIAAQPAMAFDGRSPDTREASGTAAYVFDARSPDTRSAVEQATGSSIRSDSIDDAVTRALPAIPVATSELAPSITFDSSADAVTRALPAIPVATSELAPDNFNWGDFGIGVSAAFGSILLLVLLAAAGRATRQKRRESTRAALS